VLTDTCICCGEEFWLDSDGICEKCNLEDYCETCKQHELDCNCPDTASFIYGFPDDDFSDNPHDELDDWEGDDYDEEN
jgi:hypothetical protein